MANPVESRKSTLKTAALKKVPAPIAMRIDAPAPRVSRSRKAPPPNLFAKALDIAHEDAIELLRRIMKVRASDSSGLFRGCEAALAGVGAALGADDVVISALANGSSDAPALTAIARGHEPLPAGASNGQQAAGLQHNGLVGARALSGSPAIAPGVALACRLMRKRQIAVVVMDGAATRSGAFFEALQLAVEWELPLLMVCLHEPPGAQAASHGRTWASRAESFGLTGARCDGLQTLDVRDAAKIAVSHVRQHKGPYLLELTIPAAARTPSAEDDSGRSDPLFLFRARLIEADALNAESAAQLQHDIVNKSADGRRA